MIRLWVIAVGLALVGCAPERTASEPAEKEASEAPANEASDSILVEVVDTPATSLHTEAGSGLDFSLEPQLLEPAAFPALPTRVRVSLESRGCQIPQAFWPESQNNVVQGSFGGPHQQDWAVLCSVAGRSTIVIVWEDDTSACPSEFGAGSDTGWNQSIGQGRVGFSRALGRSAPSRISQQMELWPDDFPSDFVADHDGLEEAFLEKASTIYYCVDGTWLELRGSD